MQVQLKTILNQVQHLVGFIYQEIELLGRKDQPLAIKVQIAEHAGHLARCSKCLKPAPCYDRLRPRCWLHKPLWDIPVHFHYTPRRVKCAEHGVVVEHMPWSVGKRPYMQQQVQSLDLNVPVSHERTIAEQIAIASWRQRMTGMLTAVFAAVALLLAVIGVYGVVSFTVSQRTREFGIRMALGASPRKLHTVIVVEGGKIAIAGVVAGVLMALVFTKFVTSLLYGVGARDPLVFLAVASGLLILALIASYVPARRATKVDPAVVLRDE